MLLSVLFCFSAEEHGATEIPETARLRDRGSKKDRDRERDRDRDRDRSSRSKRRRGDRLMHGSNREDGGEECTEESVNDEEDEEEDDAGAIRILPPNPSSLSSSKQGIEKNYKIEKRINQRRKTNENGKKEEVL